MKLAQRMDWVVSAIDVCSFQWVAGAVPSVAILDSWKSMETAGLGFVKSLLVQKVLIVVLGPWVAHAASDPIVVSPAGVSKRTDLLSLARMQESMQ